MSYFEMDPLLAQTPEGRLAAEHIARTEASRSKWRALYEMEVVKSAYLAEQLKSAEAYLRHLHGDDR